MGIPWLLGNQNNYRQNCYRSYNYSNGDCFEGEYKDGYYLKDQPLRYSSKLNSKLEGYKTFCSEIGFTPGTEKFGDCVLEAMKKG